MSGAEYGDFQITRRLGVGVTVDVAPKHAKIALDFLSHPAGHVRVQGGDIVIADQVVYRTTGYDPADYTLTVELVTDWRPGQKDDPHAEAQT